MSFMAYYIVSELVLICMIRIAVLRNYMRLIERVEMVQDEDKSVTERTRLHAAFAISLPVLRVYFILRMVHFIQCSDKQFNKMVDKRRRKNGR